MKAVVSAIESGRCSVAVSGALLRDPDVMLALKERNALMPMALSGPAVAPVLAVGDLGVARAVGAPNGVLVLVEPELSDQKGVGAIAKLIGRAGHKPRVYVVSRSFNPFSFGALQGLKIEHIKGRGKAFLKDLPLPPEGQDAPELVKPVKPKKAGDLSVRFSYVGREEEQAQLVEMLGQGGPIVVSGLPGIGKRTLAEHAIAATELKRLPDMRLGREFGFDTLLGRLAVICKEAGASGLFDALQNAEAKPTDLIAVAIESLQAASTDAVMLLEGLHVTLGRQGDFFRKSRLEMLLIALLTNTYPLRLVFTSIQQPILYREGAGQHLRRISLEGLKGRFLHDIFEAYKAPEFPRDRIGAIADKVGGHPLATRAYAVEVRERPDGIKLTDDAKFMKLGDNGRNLDSVKKRLEKRIEKLGRPERAMLAGIAHFPRAVEGPQLADIKIGRKPRLHLLGQGLLDLVGTETNRRYRVHPLVRSQLSWRETTDFDVFRLLAEQHGKSLKDAEGLDKLVGQQDLNRALTASRQLRSRVETEVPDNDSMVESCIGMIRSRKPNFQLAGQRLTEIIKAQPGNADAHLLRLELAAAEEREAREAKRDAKAKRKKGEAKAEAPKANDAKDNADNKGTNAFLDYAEQAMAAAPVPEVFHRVAGYWLGRRARHKAIEVLEAAVVAMPDESRLHCRLGSLLLRHGRRNEAVAALQKAMELEPMLPDAYGLLGMAKRDEGADSLADAETLLREAVRLGPEDPVQTARLADLLIHKASTETDAGKRSDGFNEAKELLELSLREDRKAPEAQLLLAQLHRRSGADLERAGWLLSQAKKNTDRGGERHHRIAMERALLMLAQGQLDQAESLTRDQVARNPSSHTGFATLAHVLEARQQLIPAHAEFLRAKERAPQGSLWAAQYDTELARLQGLIEAQAAGLYTPPPPPGAATPAPEGEQRAAATGNTAHRVIRRKRSEGGDAPAEAVDAAPVDAPAPVEAAPVEAAVPVETAAPAEAAPVEAAPMEAAAPVETAAPVESDDGSTPSV